MDDTNKTQSTHNEEFKVSGQDIMKKVREIIEEGNARRVIVKNDKGDTIVEIPVTVGVVGALLVPWLAVIGTTVALVSSCTIIIEKRN